MSTTRVVFGGTDSAYDAGINIPSTRHAWFTLCWCLTLAGTAWAQVDVVTVNKEEPICSDTDDPDIDVPVNVCNVFVHLTEPSVKFLAVGSADITTDDPAGFFQHPFDLTDTAPLCSSIPAFPSLVCDSFVTIALKCDDGSDSTSTLPDFSTVEFNLNGHVVGSWFVSAPFSDQGLPDENGNVLVAQLAVTEGFDISGSFTAFVQGDFGAPLDCADLNGDDEVGAFDLAVLLGSWGACPGCPADLNGDGTVDVGDLAWLLATWGPCEDKTLPFAAFELTFSCFGPACEVDEDCDDGDPCTADTCVKGKCEASPADCNDNGTPDCDDIAEETSADCNGNSVPDECDIAGGFSSDIVGPGGLPDGIPDECQLDCNGNLIPDDLDISGGASPDCNGNGIPDECEIDENSPAPGGPFFCVENCDPDCNDNGIPDECDIADCPPETPACDDCNLNGVPDECDIDSGFSEDVDMNGVPDECVAAQSDGEWSADIWGLEGENPYPDNQQGVPDQAVTVDGVSVFLDVDAEVPALRLINAATLDVTQDGSAGDLTIADAAGVFDGNLLIEGTLNIGGERFIDAAGTVTIGTGGVYKSIFGLQGPASGDLMADEIVIECGGTLRLEGTMNLGTTGDITLQSSADDDKGDCTPPDFEAGDDSTASVGGDFTIQGPANIDYNSSQPLLLGGDFDNRSTDAAIFDWSAGGILLNGPLHTIEAAGEDRGRWPAGLVQNFAIGTLTVAAEATVQVIDLFDNQQDGAAECDEALYLDTCVVEAGATLLTNGCHVYYKELFNEGSIPGLGIDVLEILDPVPADFNGDGKVDAFDLAFLLGNWGDCPDPCAPGEPAETCTTDLNGDCITEAFDLASLLGSWGGP